MSNPPPISINIAIGRNGPIPTPPANINATLINYVAMVNPGYTVLPAGLVEDWSSTSTYAIALCDSAAVDLENSLTPYLANPWLLYQLGTIYGVVPGVETNTSVYVVFTGTVGFIINVGFVVTDGTYQYIIQDGGIIGSGGSSLPLYAVATIAGAWAVPDNTVTTIVTSVPISITLSVTNPNTGTPSPGPETEEQYRARVLQAGLSSSQGNTSYLKTLLGNVPGVQPRLVSALDIDSGGWEIIVGGGDPYQVANAIYNSGIDISTLSGSNIGILNITNASPGVVTTNLNHGLTNGQNNVYINGASGMTGANGGPYTVTVIDQTHFSFGINTTSFGAYISGGVVTPNNRNVMASIIDWPDIYSITFVNPPQQTVQVQLSWNTTAPDVTSSAAVAQAAAPAIATYITGLFVGTPINEFQLNKTFTEATTGLILAECISTLLWTISINGVETLPEVDTGLVYGDPESYFYCTSNNVTITEL